MKQMSRQHTGETQQMLWQPQKGRRGIFKDIRVKGNKANETTEDSEDKKTEVKLSMRHKRQKNPSIYPSIQFFPFQKKLQNEKQEERKDP